MKKYCIFLSLFLIVEAAARTTRVHSVAEQIDSAKVVLLVSAKKGETTEVLSRHENSDHRWNRIRRSIFFSVDVVMKGSYTENHYLYIYETIVVTDDKHGDLHSIYIDKKLPQFRVNLDVTNEEMFPHEEYSPFQIDLHPSRGYLLLLRSADGEFKLLDSGPSLYELNPDVHRLGVGPNYPR